MANPMRAHDIRHHRSDTPKHQTDHSGLTKVTTSQIDGSFVSERGAGVRVVMRFCQVAVLTAVSTLCAGLLPAATGRAVAASPSTTLHGDGSVEEAWLTGANPSDRITLIRHGAAVPVPGNPGTADALGSLIVRNLKPGHGYSWHDDTTGQRTLALRRPGPRRQPAGQRSAVHRPTACTKG